MVKLLPASSVVNDVVIHRSEVTVERRQRLHTMPHTISTVHYTQTDGQTEPSSPTDVQSLAASCSNTLHSSFRP